jgi:uncharacterized damage-inducible protein DinB
MSLSDAILPEFDSEMANVRSWLERLQDGEFNWRPLQSSMTLGELVAHMATISHLVDAIISRNSLDVTDDPPQSLLGSRGEVLDVFDRNVVSARRAIAGASDDQLVNPWSLLKESKIIVTLPRLAALRNFVLNHSVRHRADLQTYLRLKNVPVAPSPYRERATPA